jgi:ADP-ribosylglycohydrolase
MNNKYALLSLDGLSVGDAFGERFFRLNPLDYINSKQIPEGKWTWTDDTHMALSIVEILDKYGFIDQDHLMKRFCSRYMNDKRLGYGSGTRQLLEQVFISEDWRKSNAQFFPGGSYGNGAAMRVAPIGGYFSGDLDRVANEASLSAEVTHAHPEGMAGAIAVAVAASIASQSQFPIGIEFLNQVKKYVPNGKTKEGIIQSLEISPNVDIAEAVRILGNGSAVSSQDTVPFCLWIAAYHLDDYKEALWATVSGLGDRDTTCAIVGGIVALSTKKIPEDWLDQRESLPRDFLDFDQN